MTLRSHLALAFSCAALLSAGLAGCKSPGSDPLHDPVTDKADATGVKLVGKKTFGFVVPSGNSQNLSAGNVTFTMAALQAARTVAESKGYVYQQGGSPDFLLAATWSYGLDRVMPSATETTKPSTTGIVEYNALMLAASDEKTHGLLWKNVPGGQVRRDELTEAKAMEFAREAMLSFPEYTPPKEKK